MIAIDTNILIYCLDRTDSVKRTKAKAVVRKLASGSDDAILMWQVAGELIRQIQYWRVNNKISDSAPQKYLQLFRRMFRLIMPTAQSIEVAIDLSKRYSLSHWDSMLLAACLEAQVDTLYTEDMGSPTDIAGIRLVNPFV